MLCGYLKQTCRSIKVKDLIEILKLCKNQDAIIKYADTTNFYIHFDQDGQFINFDKNAQVRQYGNAGAEDTCESCRRYDKKQKCCKCDGTGCLNAESIIDTEKLNETHSRIEDVSIDTESGASTTPILNDKYDLSNFGINGTSINNANETEREIPKRRKVVKQPDVVEEVKKQQSNGISIQDAVDNAIIKTLTKMINGIKGE